MITFKVKNSKILIKIIWMHIKIYIFLIIILISKIVKQIKMIMNLMIIIIIHKIHKDNLWVMKLIIYHCQVNIMKIKYQKH